MLRSNVGFLLDLLGYLSLNIEFTSKASKGLFSPGSIFLGDWRSPAEAECIMVLGTLPILLSNSSAGISSLQYVRSIDGMDGELQVTSGFLNYEVSYNVYTLLCAYM